jgi:hypothetical protein
VNCFADFTANFIVDAVILVEGIIAEFNGQPNGQPQRNESKTTNKYEIWTAKHGGKYNKEGRFQFADCHYGSDFDRVLAVGASDSIRHLVKRIDFAESGGCQATKHFHSWLVLEKLVHVRTNGGIRVTPHGKTVQANTILLP